MLGTIFKEQERERFEAANGNKGSSKKGDCRKCLVSDSWPEIESLGEPVAVSGMLMRCLTSATTGLSLWLEKIGNGKWEYKTAGRAGGNSNCMNPGKTGWKNNKSLGGSEHFTTRTLTELLAPWRTRQILDILWDQRTPQGVTHEQLVLLSLLFFAFRMYFYSAELQQGVFSVYTVLHQRQEIFCHKYSLVYFSK